MTIQTTLQVVIKFRFYEKVTKICAIFLDGFDIRIISLIAESEISTNETQTFGFFFGVEIVFSLFHNKVFA